MTMADVVQMVRAPDRDSGCAGSSPVVRPNFFAGMVKLADTLVLGTSFFRSGGSNPSTGTKFSFV